MYFKPVVKKSLACFISIVFSVVFFASYMNIRTYAFDYTQGIMFGQYYRIRNAKSNLYITMNSHYDNDNIGCSLQIRSSNLESQIFYLDKDLETNTYYLSPLTSSTNRVLSLTSSSDTNNNMVVLKTKTSADTQKWRIMRSQYGYHIQTYSGTKALAPASLGTSAGTTIATWSYTTNTCDWILDPAYTGSASYHVLTTLSSADDTVANNIMNTITYFGYSGSRSNLPTVQEMRIRTASNRLVVFHGHGNIGYMVAEQKDGTNDLIYSENKPLGAAAEYDFFGNRNTYVFFLTCYSATTSSERCSMIQAAIAEGAGCATGFKNTVSNGEVYLEIVMNYMKLNPSMPIEDALANADKQYTAAQREELNCPANSKNRVTIGVSDVTLDLT